MSGRTLAFLVCVPAFSQPSGDLNFLRGLGDFRDARRMLPDYLYARAQDHLARRLVQPGADEQPFPLLTSFTTTNYDRTIAPCYCLGEHLSVDSANGATYVLWGDGRNTVTEPVNPLSPPGLSGLTHPQTDVFFQKVMAQ